MDLAEEVFQDIASQLANLQGKKILVSGATGFVGRHLLDILILAGAKVSCLVRPDSTRLKNLPSTVQIVKADFADLVSLKQALENCEIFIHLAAHLFGTNWHEYLEKNVGMAENIAKVWQSLEKEQKAPKRCVFLSSLAASGPCAEKITEKELLERSTQPLSAYGWSKWIAEQVLARTLAKKLVCARASIIYGSGDRGLLPVFRGLKYGLAVIPGIGRNFPVSLIHVLDVAKALALLCLEQAEGIYHLSDGQVYNLKIFYQKIALALECQRTYFLSLPLCFMAITAYLATFAAFLLKLPARLIGKKNWPNPQWNIDKYKEASATGWLCLPERLEQEFNFKPYFSLEAGLKEAVQGYRSLGLLK